MTLTSLTSLLEIKHNLVRIEHHESFTLAEAMWKECGKPIDPRGLIDALERILTACQQRRIFYHPVLLARKKALERGTWVPTKISVETGLTCSRCGGKGYYQRDGTTATLCECGAWPK